jgi:hypothetical protein
MTEFEAHKLLVAGKITLTEYRELTKPEPTKPIVKSPSLKNFLPRRDATLITDFTIADLDKWQEEGYFRVQDMDWKVGLKSWGMIYTSAKEAIEDGGTILDGKSCVSEWRQLYQFWDGWGRFGGKGLCVLVFKGIRNGYGHDDECVVKPEKVVVTLDCSRFLEILETEYKKADESGDDYEIHRFRV